MHIFIDESGTFTGTEGDALSVSVLGALILASHRLPKLLNRYERLRVNLPKNGKGEVKGSKLNEVQVASVIELLRKNGAIFCASMIELSCQSKAQIAAHRERRIASLAANLTNGHTQELRESVVQLQERMAGFSDQLYVQATMTIELLHNVMQDMIVYHCQRFPKELAEFHWVVDAKQPAVVTDWEDWWSKTLVIWLQAMSLTKPGAMLPGGDYRHFRRFLFDELPDYLKDVAPPGDRSRGAGVNLQMMFGESFTFSSEPLPGLELVDIVTNALRRGLIGNLGEAGWLPIRELMIHRRGVYVQALGFSSDKNMLVPKPLARVLNRFQESGRVMATKALEWPENEAAAAK
ncbi:hypothetical protein AAG593_00990 [Citromicrobium bathyomarinum]